MAWRSRQFTRCLPFSLPSPLPTPLPCRCLPLCPSLDIRDRRVSSRDEDGGACVRARAVSSGAGANARAPAQSICGGDSQRPTTPRVPVCAGARARASRCWRGVVCTRDAGGGEVCGGVGAGGGVPQSWGCSGCVFAGAVCVCVLGGEIVCVCRLPVTLWSRSRGQGS